jgi:hypothetical protein
MEGFNSKSVEGKQLIKICYDILKEHYDKNQIAIGEYYSEYKNT